MIKLKSILIYITFIFSGNVVADASISISTVANSNIIIGDNNTQNINYALKDNGVDVYLDITEDESIHRMDLFPDGNIGCAFYVERNINNKNKYIFPSLKDCVLSNEDYLYNYITKSQALAFDHAYLPWNFKVKSPVFDLRIINNKDKSIRGLL